VINALITFVVVAAVIFFFVVKPMNMMLARSKAQQAAAATPKEPTTKACPECLSMIPLKARRCAHCTSAVPV